MRPRFTPTGAEASRRIETRHRPPQRRVRQKPRFQPSVQFLPSRAAARRFTPWSNPLIPAVKTDPVKQRILTLVAEKTGYPIDMLDLDLDLEADLGVDTVKQAEVMATVRETYGIERDDKLKLRDFPTLAHVIRFVHDGRPDLAAVAPPPPRGRCQAGGKAGDTRSSHVRPGDPGHETRA